MADELEREIKRVGAPLEGLIRSTRLTVGTTTGALILAAIALAWLHLT